MKVVLCLCLLSAVVALPTSEDDWYEREEPKNPRMMEDEEPLDLEQLGYGKKGKANGIELLKSCAVQAREVSKEETAGTTPAPPPATPATPAPPAPTIPVPPPAPPAGGPTAPPGGETPAGGSPGTIEIPPGRRLLGKKGQKGALTEAEQAEQKLKKRRGELIGCCIAHLGCRAKAKKKICSTKSTTGTNGKRLLLGKKKDEQIKGCLDVLKGTSLTKAKEVAGKLTDAAAKELALKRIGQMEAEMKTCEAAQDKKFKEKTKKDRNCPGHSWSAPPNKSVGR